MESPEQTYCTNCGEKLASYFITSIHSDVKEAQKLCGSCCETVDSGFLRIFLAAMKGASCRYCGGRGPMGAGALDSAVQRHENRFMCCSCFGEYHRFLQGRFDAHTGVGEEAPSEQMRRIRSIDEQVEAHMKQWVIQRFN